MIKLEDVSKNIKEYASIVDDIKKQEFPVWKLL